MSSRLYIVLWKGQLYELNLGTFNSIFGFSTYHGYLESQSPQKFNPNAFWGKLSRSVRCSTSSSKCTHIRNPCIRVAQRILTCLLFARDDSLNVPRLFELYFLSYMLDGDQLDPVQC